MRTQSIDTPAEKIIVVEVPISAYDIEWNLAHADDYPHTTRFALQYTDIDYLTWNLYEEDLGHNKLDELKILGTVTAPDIVDFDCSGIVEKDWYDHNPDYVRWRDYSYEERNRNLLGSPEQSFLSLLANNGVHFVNPLGINEPKSSLFGFKDRERYAVKQWHEAQSKLFSKAVILLQTTKP